MFFFNPHDYHLGTGQAPLSIPIVAVPPNRRRDRRGFPFSVFIPTGEAYLECCFSPFPEFFPLH